MEITLYEILDLVKKKMREQGGYNRAAYRQFVEETIEYFLQKGKLTDEDNLEFITRRLFDMWPQVEEGLAKK